MQLRNRQKGIGIFGIAFILAFIGFTALVVMKTLPLYLNQMKVQRSVNKVASDPGNGNAEAIEIRKALQRYWDIESIDVITPKDIKIVRNSDGRFLSYDYEARERLFYNVSIVLTFQADVPMHGASGDS
ncbi:MAG TPA: DUF4845 domain-containing protein [Solimonas sp.]|nr:DUF4845 domain-containing protein [Solimonas sp.]